MAAQRVHSADRAAEAPPLALGRRPGPSGPPEEGLFRLPLTALHGAWQVAGTKEQSSRRKVPILADQRLF